jgi:hypothetical protein
MVLAVALLTNEVEWFFGLGLRIARSLRLGQIRCGSHPRNRQHYLGSGFFVNNLKISAQMFGAHFHVAKTVAPLLLLEPGAPRKIGPNQAGI